VINDLFPLSLMATFSPVSQGRFHVLMINYLIDGGGAKIKHTLSKSSRHPFFAP
jgi:hypothetical protein